MDCVICGKLTRMYDNHIEKPFCDNECQYNYYHTTNLIGLKFNNHLINICSIEDIKTNIKIILKDEMFSKNDVNVEKYNILKLLLSNIHDRINKKNHPKFLYLYLYCVNGINAMYDKWEKTIFKDKKREVDNNIAIIRANTISNDIMTLIGKICRKICRDDDLAKIYPFALMIEKKPIEKMNKDNNTLKTYIISKYLHNSKTIITDDSMFNEYFKKVVEVLSHIQIMITSNIKLTENYDNTMMNFYNFYSMNTKFKCIMDVITHFGDIKLTLNYMKNYCEYIITIGSFLNSKDSNITKYNAVNIFKRWLFERMNILRFIAYVLFKYTKNIISNNSLNPADILKMKNSYSERFLSKNKLTKDDINIEDFNNDTNIFAQKETKSISNIILHDDKNTFESKFIKIYPDFYNTDTIVKKSPSSTTL